MRRMMCAMTAAVLLAGGLMVGGGTTDAGPSLKIVKIFFDSPGSPDRNTNNGTLNAEYIAVKNVTTKAINLKGWRITDAQAHVFTFPAVSLAPGKAIAVHTGTGTANAANLYWKSNNFVWNNDTDTASLKNPAGAVVNRCKYPNRAGGVTITGTTSTGKYATCP